MARQSRRQKQVVGRVMHEFKHGELGRGPGGKVNNPKQAIAIALSEAGASNRQSPGKNRRRLHQTEHKQQAGRAAQAGKTGEKQAQGKPADKALTRQDLYQQARQAGIPGRSHMTKDELQQTLTRHQA